MPPFGAWRDGNRTCEMLFDLESELFKAFVESTFGGFRANYSQQRINTAQISRDLTGINSWLLLIRSTF